MGKSIRQQRGTARTKRPERTQVEMQLLSLDQWLDKDHRARVVWQYAQSLDLSELYARIEATESNSGRDAIDPRILFALWLLATLEGFSSARRLAKLCTRDIPYMWTCGGVSVNYHRLSDFRVDHGDLLERLMVDSITVLKHQKLISLNVIAQDGMRVRASAGSSSFRREPTLDDCLAEAQAYVQQLKEQAEEDASGDDRRQKAAAERAAREKVERITAAKEELAELKKRREKNKSGKKASEPRASTTDPEARRMKMGDNGFRPAMNVQFGSDGETRLIVGVDLVNQGSDQGLMAPMHQQIVGNYDTTPKHYLVDGGFTKKEDIDQLDGSGTTVYGSLANEKKQLKEGKDPYAAKPRDSEAMKSFRERMGTEEGKEMYSQRAGIAEFPNAECRNRGLSQFRVRGLVKAKAQTLWHVLAFNFMRMQNLCCPLREQNYLEILMET